MCDWRNDHNEPCEAPSRLLWRIGTRTLKLCIAHAMQYAEAPAHGRVHCFVPLETSHADPRSS